MKTPHTHDESSSSDPEFAQGESADDGASSKPLEHWRRALSARREESGIAADPMPLARLIQALKTLAWVAPFTLLIWIYAEREESAEMPNVPINFRVQTNAANRIVTMLDAQGRQVEDFSVSADLLGPRAAIDRVMTQLRTNTIQLTVDPKLPPGIHAIFTSALADTSIFADQGISIRDPRPETVTVDIDEVIERSLPVRAEPGMDTLAEQPVFSPQQVSVRAPASLFARGADHVTAQLSGLQELKQPGRHDKILNVPVTWDFHDENVRFNPLTVTASIVVKERNRTYIIPSVTIWPMAPAGFFDKYRVECPPRIANVTVSGPPDKIEAIANNTFPVKARLEISADDPIGQDREKLPMFDLPPGVELAGDSATHTVSFKVVTRAGTE